MGVRDGVLQYRTATLDDLDMLTATRVTVLRAANGLEPSADMSRVEEESRRYYATALPERSHLAILVLDGEQAVGAGCVSFYRVMPTFHNPGGRKAYIMNMYTAPAYRNRGIAYHTLELLVAEAKKRGVGHISLEATEMGRPLYEKFGFVQMRGEMELPG